jgi:tellurite resistance protein
MSKSVRKLLIQMACVAAWADLEVVIEEKEVIMGMAQSLELEADDLTEIESWLDSPPPDFDPNRVPKAFRAAFLDAFVHVIAADGRIEPEESSTVQLLRELID